MNETITIIQAKKIRAPIFQQVGLSTTTTTNMLFGLLFVLFYFSVIFVSSLVSFISSNWNFVTHLPFF
jgi:hypothetical protein